MNTFVVKSKNQSLHGNYIGMSTKDSQYIFVFRSHKLFKDINPDLKEYTVIDGEKLKDEFDFKKNNVCSYCGGLKYFYHIQCDKPINGKTLKDEWGYTLFSKDVCANCICDDGTYIGLMEHWAEMEKRDTDELGEAYMLLKGYILSNSKCKTCEGDQDKTYEHFTCKECDLPGTKHFIMGG